MKIAQQTNEIESAQFMFDFDAMNMSAQRTHILSSTRLNMEWNRFDCQITFDGCRTGWAFKC